VPVFDLGMLFSLEKLKFGKTKRSEKKSGKGLGNVWKFIFKIALELYTISYTISQ